MQDIEQLKTELRTRDSSLKMLGVCPCAVKSSRLLHCCAASMQLLRGALPSIKAQLPVQTHHCWG